MNYDVEDPVLVPRHRVFVLADGTFVVQWEANQVQDLLSGRYHAYDERLFGNPITDWELNQLQIKKLVERFDNEYVYLCPLPTIVANTPARSFYLNTGLTKFQKNELEQALKAVNLEDKYSVRSQAYYAVVRGANGLPFNTFDEAERARELLSQKLPDWFGMSVVAFIEVNNI